MQADLRPGDGFKQFVESAIAAGQREDGVGELVNAGLALVHGGDKLERGETVVRNLAALERVWQHANDFSAGGQRRVGHCAHQAAAGSAVDQAQAGLRDGGAESCGLGAKGGIVSEGRSADRRRRGEEACLNWSSFFQNNGRGEVRSELAVREQKTGTRQQGSELASWQVGESAFSFAFVFSLGG